MAEIADILLDALRSAVLISGLVVVMMMLIESMNISSRGDFFGGLRRSRVGQVVISAFLGAIPGCMGGFASVSLYTHGIISFGALVAMMIASSGDEAFVMLATIPGDAVKVFLVLLAVAVAVGVVVDLLYPAGAPKSICKEEFAVHGEEETTHGAGRHFGWKRVAMLAGVVLFLVALLSGMLEHEEHVEGTGEAPAGLLVNLLSEEWMYWLFGVLSLIVLGVLVFGRDHFVEEHLWHHIVRRHLPSVFLWTFGVLVLLGAGLHFLDITSWISSNTAWMIILATLVGIIPESGPHLVFVTLYAAGVVPMPVLLASCISQDGHASLPLFAESKKGFLAAKTVNCLVALAVGFAAMLLM
jgi:hypothetical protein